MLNSKTCQETEEKFESFDIFRNKIRELEQENNNLQKIKNNLQKEKNKAIEEIRKLNAK